MSRVAEMPASLRRLPFRGSGAVASGSLTRAQLRGESWVRLLPDIYVAADVAMDLRLWAYAACLYAGLDAVASGVSAAAVWGVDIASRWAHQQLSLAEVTVPVDRRVRSRPPSVAVVRATLPAADVTTSGRFALTTPERTAVDLVRRLPYPEGIVALDAMLNRRLVALDSLVARASAMGGHYGGAAFARAVRLAEPKSESPMESRVRLQLVGAGLPRPVAQFEVRDSSGLLLGRLDLAYPRHRLGLEYEGDHHRDRTTFRRDIGRINALQDAGWVIIRVTADDILRNPSQLVQRVSRLLSEIRVTAH